LYARTVPVELKKAKILKIFPVGTGKVVEPCLGRVFLRCDQHCFPTFQTLYNLDFSSASRSGTLRFSSLKMSLQSSKTHQNFKIFPVGPRKLVEPCLGRPKGVWDQLHAKYLFAFTYKKLQKHLKILKFSY
jgi:hypothetical protein